MEIIAHRGFSAIAPENTLAAFELAIQQGANSVEFDVQLSADGIPVIFHDVTLDRITKTPGNVRDKTLEELKQLDAGAWFSNRFSGEKIPTLKEALSLLKKIEKYLYFDVKPHCEWSDAEVQDLVYTLEQENLADRCIMTSFSDRFLEQVRRVSNTLQRGHIVANKDSYMAQLDKAHDNGDRLISSLYHILLENPSLVEQTKSQGVDIVAWTVDQPEDLQNLRDLDIVRVVTNSLIG